MKLWVDDVRPAPEGYDWCKSVNEAKNEILECEAMIRCSRSKQFWEIEVIDLDFKIEGRAAFLDWLEETGRNYPICIHSMNPVGRENMRRIIQRNGWTEVM